MPGLHGAARTLELAFLHKLACLNSPPRAIPAGRRRPQAPYSREHALPLREADGASGPVQSFASVPARGVADGAVEAMLQRLRQPALCAGESQALRPTRPCEAPFGTPTSRRGGATPVTFSGTQPVEPDPILRPVWLSRHKPSGSRPSRPLLIPVQSHRRPAPGLRPTERVLGADSVRAVVPPGVTSLVRLTYGLAARERLGTGCQPRVSR